MTNLKRLLLVTASVTAIFIQGCGCSDSKKRGAISQPESTFEISGQASKGVLIGASVTAYRFSSGQLDTSTSIASSTTGTNGSYSLNIPESHQGASIVVRVTPAASGTLMRCDLPAGCGAGIEFGEDAPIAADSGLRLDAVVAYAQPAIPTNVTFLTSVAAGVALDALTSSATAAEVVSAIASANSQVANRFGLVGDLTRMPVIDLTDSTAVAAALSAGNSRYVQYASLNAAIVQAVMADGAASIASSITAFTNAYVAQGLAGNTVDPTATGMGEILGAARALIEVVEVRAGGALDLAAIDAGFATEQEFANSEEPDQFDPGTPSDTTGKSELEIVKAMVSDVRDLSLSIGSSALGDGATIGSVHEAFGLQVEAADLATSTDVMVSVQAMGMAMNAIDEARSALELDPALGSFTALNGVPVTITEAAGVISFQVEQDISVMHEETSYSVAVDLTATSEEDYVDASEGSTSNLKGNVIYSISGSAATSAITMAIKPGSAAVIGALDMVVVDDPTTGGTDQSHALGELSFTLNMTLAQKTTDTVTDPISVDGGFVVEVANVTVDLLETTDTGEFTATVSTITLQFSGSVQNTSGEKYRFAFAANGDASGVTFSEVWDATTETITAETPEGYAMLSANLQFTADLAGQLNAVVVKVGATRTGQDDGLFLLSLAYPGKKLMIESQVVDGEMGGTITATNQDGVVLTVTRTEVAGEMVASGSISLNGTQHANIATGTTGMVTITYSDDTFESL